MMPANRIPKGRRHVNLEVVRQTPNTVQSVLACHLSGAMWIPLSEGMRQAM